MTGATGLLGTWVRRVWIPAHPGDLVEATHSEVDLLADQAFVNLIDRVRPATVLHLAWTAGGTSDYRQDPANHRWTTVTLEAAEHCLAIGARFIALGTVLDDGPASDAYSRSKHELRQALEPHLGGGGVVWLRPFYVFDAQEGRPTVLGMARAAQKAGMVPTVRQPLAQHDFVHAEDVARGIVATIREGLEGVIEIGSGRQRTVAQLMRGASFAWTADEQPTDEEHDNRVADISRLRAVGWTTAETDRYFGDE